MAAQPNWQDESDDTFCIRAEFGDGSTSYTTLKHAADALDFIDRDQGIADLQRGVTLRSHMGTMFTIVGIPVPNLCDKCGSFEFIDRPHTEVGCPVAESDR